MDLVEQIKLKCHQGRCKSKRHEFDLMGPVLGFGGFVTKVRKKLLKIVRSYGATP
jgi:hypothetical protein